MRLWFAGFIDVLEDSVFLCICASWPACWRKNKSCLMLDLHLHLFASMFVCTGIQYMPSGSWRCQHVTQCNVWNNYIIIIIIIIIIISTTTIYVCEVDKEFFPLCLTDIFCILIVIFDLFVYLLNVLHIIKLCKNLLLSLKTLYLNFIHEKWCSLLPNCFCWGIQILKCIPN